MSYGITSINQLNPAIIIQPSDSIPTYLNDQGASRKISIALLTEYMSKNIPQSTKYTKVYNTISISNPVLTLPDTSSNIWAIVPFSTTSSGDLFYITFPNVENCSDQQIIQFVFKRTSGSNTIVPTVDLNGATLVGGTIDMAAYRAIRIMLDKPSKVWYMISVT